MEFLAYSALLPSLPPTPRDPSDTLVLKNQTWSNPVWGSSFSWMATLGSTASLVLISSTLPAGAIVKQGATCDAVKDIQQALTAKKYDVGGVDGIFGAQTYRAIVKFQTDQKLDPDGIVGSQTAGALGLTGAVYVAGANCETVASSASAPSSATANSETRTQYTVMAEALNVRSGPATSYQVVDVLFKGDAVEASAPQSGWLEISKDQWISAQFVEPVEENSAESGASTNEAKTESSTNSSSNSTAATPTVINSSSIADESPEESPEITIIDIEELDPALSTGYIRVVAEALNVRSDPSTANNVVGYVAKDEILPLTGKATQNGWIQLAWGDWLSSAFVEPVIVEEGN